MPELVPRALDERLAVAGLADGGRGDGHGALGAAGAGHGDEAAHDAQGAVDGFGAELAIAGHVADEAERTARVAEHVQVGRARTRATRTRPLFEPMSMTPSGPIRPRAGLFL